MIGLILAVLAGIFHYATLIPNLIIVLTLLSIICIGIGSLTGK